MLFTGAGGAPTTIQLYEGIVAAGGDPFDFAHPGTVDTFRFLAALRPSLSSESCRAKWHTTNEALAPAVAYLAQNWPFGVPLLIQEYGKTAIRTYSGWAGPVREAHVIGGDVLGLSVGAPQRQLALALIRHLQSREVQRSSPTDSAGPVCALTSRPASRPGCNRMWPLWEKPCVMVSFAPISATGPHTNAWSMKRYSVFCGAMRPSSRLSHLWPHAWMLYGSTRETLHSFGPGTPRSVPGGVHRNAGGLYPRPQFSYV